MGFIERAIENAKKAKESHPDAVILVRLIGYFAFGDDADVLNKVLNKEILKYRGTKYSHFPIDALASELPLLIRKGYRVRII